MPWIPSNKSRPPTKAELSKANKIREAKDYINSAMIDAFEAVGDLDTTEKSELARARILEDQARDQRIEAELKFQKERRKRLEDDIGLRPNQLKPYSDNAVKFIEFIFLEFPAELPLVSASSRAIVKCLPYLISEKIGNTLEIDPFMDYHEKQFGTPSLILIPTPDIVASLYSIGFTKDYVEYLYREYLKTFIR